MTMAVDKTGGGNWGAKDKEKEAAGVPARQSAQTALTGLENVPASKVAITLIRQSAPVMKRLGVKDPGRVEEVIRLALAENPYLAQCVQNPVAAKSMVVAVCRALSMGLDSFGGPLATAYLVPFWDKKANANLIQLIPSYKGITGIALRDGLVKRISVGIVYASDEDSLVLQDGMDRRLDYTPDFRAPRRLYAPGTTEIATDNPPLLAWCAWTLASGERDFDWMNIQDVLRVRDNSKAWDPAKPWQSPWGAWPEAQTNKTIIKHASKLWGLGMGEKHKALREVLERAGVEDTGQTPPEDVTYIDMDDAGEVQSPGDRLAEKVGG